MSEIILVNLMGSDRPGITRDLSGILAQHGARILDIGQSVIHDTLTLGMLIELPPVSESHPVLKDMPQADRRNADSNTTNPTMIKFRFIR